MTYKCIILADSITGEDKPATKYPTKSRLTTFEITYPRMVLAEFNTHRMISKSAASSRAIPVQKIIDQVLTDPVLPVWWGKNQSGMQAQEELQGQEKQEAKQSWLAARDTAVNSAKDLLAKGLHKQIVNRVMEPWMWVTCIVSATDWDNFFALRCHPDAQPEIRMIANMMQHEMHLSVPKIVLPGHWHIPLVPDLDELQLLYSIEDICKIATGRAARVSYLTHAGKRDPKADIELCTKLLESGHMSPFEHVAQADKKNKLGLTSTGGMVYHGNFLGWKQYRKTIPGEACFKL